jgi:hypothetical protein
VKDPNAVEVDEKMGCGPFFKVSLEEGTVPFDAAELHEALCGRNVG